MENYIPEIYKSVPLRRFQFYISIASDNKNQDLLVDSRLFLLNTIPDIFHAIAIHTLSCCRYLFTIHVGINTYFVLHINSLIIQSYQVFVPSSPGAFWLLFGSGSCYILSVRRPEWPHLLTLLTNQKHFRWNYLRFWFILLQNFSRSWWLQYCFLLSTQFRRWLLTVYTVWNCAACTAKMQVFIKGFICLYLLVFICITFLFNINYLISQGISEVGN